MKIAIFVLSLLATAHLSIAKNPLFQSCTRRKDLFSNGKYLKSVCLLNQNADHDNSRRLCDKYGMNQFIINNEVVMRQFYDAVVNIIPEHPKEVVWINGRRNTNSKNWKITNQFGNNIGPLYSGVEFYSKYAIGNCLTLSGQYQSGHYQALPRPCNGQYWSACEYNLRTENPPPLNTNQCFYKKDLSHKGKYIKSVCAISNSLNYDQVRRSCVNLGMNLLAIDNGKVEEAFFENCEDLLMKYPGGYFWINGKRDCDSTNWKVYHPNNTASNSLDDEIEFVKGGFCGKTGGNCLLLSGQYGSYQALGASCTGKAWFLCEYKK